MKKQDCDAHAIHCMKENAQKKAKHQGIGAQCNIDKFEPTTVESFNCGSYNKVCKYCNALGYNAETLSTNKDIVHFGQLCCNQGKIKLKNFPWLYRLQVIVVINCQRNMIMH